MSSARNSADLRGVLIPAFIGAGISLFFIKSGLFSFFFLVPFGFLSVRYNYRVAWTAFLIAAVGNALFTLSSTAAAGLPVSASAWNIFYFTGLMLIFTWIMAPPHFFPVQPPGSIRLVIGSCLGALLIGLVMTSEGFFDYAASMLNVLISSYTSSGGDVVQTALMESMSGEMLLGVMKSVILRGGSLASCVFLLFASHQLSLALANLAQRGRNPYFKRNTLALFHVDPIVIWVLSLSLLLVILTRMASLETLEILLWNILVLCCILYLAQGLGIVQFFLAKSVAAPVLRLFLTIVFIILIFSPVVNVILLGCVILLGIAENWAPFRASKINGPPSTPEAPDSSTGDDAPRE